MTESIRGFTPGDPLARGVDPTRFKTRSDNGCGPRPPKPAPALPPPPACERPRCDQAAVDDADERLCARHAVEEAEWRSIDVTRLRQRPRGHPEGSPTPRHPEGSNDG